MSLKLLVLRFLFSIYVLVCLMLLLLFDLSSLLPPTISGASSSTNSSCFKLNEIVELLRIFLADLRYVYRFKCGSSLIFKLSNPSDFLSVPIFTPIYDFKKSDISLSPTKSNPPVMFDWSLLLAFFNSILWLDPINLLLLLLLSCLEFVYDFSSDGYSSSSIRLRFDYAGTFFASFSWR